MNGKIVREMGVLVDPFKDVIAVDGETILTAQKPKPQYIALNKPIGYTSTVSDPNAHHTVLELVEQVPGRLYPVGRLDVDSEGLLLLTNDGEFANRLTHPRYHVPKVYEVRVEQFVERATADKLAAGIELIDGVTAPAELKFIDYDIKSKTTILQITLYEGRNRQARRMMEAVGHPVKSLVRVQFGNIRLGLLNPGTWRKLTATEVDSLIALAKPTPTPTREKRTPKLPPRTLEGPPPSASKAGAEPSQSRPPVRPTGPPVSKQGPSKAPTSRPGPKSGGDSRGRSSGPPPARPGDPRSRPQAPRPTDKSKPRPVTQPGRPRAKDDQTAPDGQPFRIPRPPRPPGKIKTPPPPRPSPPRFRRRGEQDS